MEMDSAPETSDNFHTWRRPSAHPSILLHSAPRDIFKPLHIVEFIKGLLRAVCQNALLRHPDDILITHFMSPGADVCWQRFAPAAPVTRPGAARRVVWGRPMLLGPFLVCSYLTFTTASCACFIEVILSVLKWKENHSFFYNCDWNITVSHVSTLHVPCTVRCNIVVLRKPTKCTFHKLMLSFLIFDIFYMFRARRFIFRKTAAHTVTVQCSVLYTNRNKQSSRQKSVLLIPMHVERTVPYLYI